MTESEMPVTGKVEKPDNVGLFPNKDMLDLANFVAILIGTIVTKDTVIVVGSQDVKGIYFEVQFGDPDKSCGILIGRRFRTVNAVLEILRHQQVMPHNRFIELRLLKSDGTLQKIVNRRVYKAHQRDTPVEQIGDMIANMRYASDSRVMQQIRQLDEVIEACEEQLDLLGGRNE
jgi:hypothetical protein